MSDLFAQLGAGIRFPDANINDGGLLPTSLSGPAGINGDPDGRINFNSELLSGVTPYAYGPGRMGSDCSYQQIPHRMQKIISKLFLPYADILNDKGSLGLSHAVDQGDVAFILQSSRVQSLLFDNMAMRDAAIHNQDLPAYSAFVNISTVNYILAGLQRLDAACSQHGTWCGLARDLGYNYKNKHSRLDVLRLVSTRLVPFGICAGSKKKGGLHETGLAPVQAAVNHVTTMTVDGQNRDLVNFWRGSDISAGDELIYRLAWLPTQHYTLNHYYKGTVRQSFVRRTMCWQLVPDVFCMSDAPRPEATGPWDYDYRVNGYWRLAQSFQHRGKYESDMVEIGNDMCFMRGQLLQVTFAPVWVQFQPLNHVDSLLDARPAPAGEVLADAGTKRKRPLFEVHNATAQRQAAPFPSTSLLHKPAPRVNILNWKTPSMQTAATALQPLLAAPAVMAAPAVIAAPAAVEVARPGPAPPVVARPDPVNRPVIAPPAPVVPRPALSGLREQMILLQADSERAELTLSPRAVAPADDGKVRKVMNKGRRGGKSSDDAAS